MDATQPSESPHATLRLGQPWERFALFKGVDPAVLSTITAHLVLRQFSAGDTIIEQNRWCGELFILRAGIVEISAVSSESNSLDTREVPLRRLVSGECFGEMSLITGGLPSATVRALTDVEAWTLNQQDFERFVRDHPSLTRNINVILSERLLHTSRQQLGDSFQQVIVIVADRSSLWSELARALALLSTHPTLFVDFTNDHQNPTEGSSIATLTDLLNGRLRSGAATPDGMPLSRGSGMLTTVRGTARDGDTVGPAVDLPVALNRLGDTYRQVLITIPQRHPQLSSHLLAFANRVLVSTSVGARSDLRTVLASLPVPMQLRDRLDIGIVLTDAPAAITPTVATLDRLATQHGAPIRALVPDARERRAVIVGALARWLVRQRIGLVLGGGGPKGWALVGVLRVLDRARIPFDYVVGASIGSMVGALFAGGYSTAVIEAHFAAGSSRAFQLTIPHTGLLSSRRLANWLHTDVFGDRLIEDLQIPMAIGAVDLNSGSEVLIQRGPIWQAVLASSAIPAIYPPVRIGPHCLVDGGVMNPVPVSTARMLGADIVVAVDLSTPLAPPQDVVLDATATQKLPNILATTLRSFDIMTAEIRSQKVGEPSVLVKPSVTATSLRHFRDGARFIAAGEEAAEAALPQLFRRLPWLE